MPGDGSQRGGSPFIFRKLRPELKSDEPAAPLLPAAPRPADLKRHVSELLGEGLRERLGVSDSGRLALAPGRVFLPNAEWVCAQLDGESVLLNLRTADSCSLNRAGTLIWEQLCEGRTLRAVRQALSRRFDVSPKVAWADLTALVSELCREKILLERPPGPARLLGASLRNRAPSSRRSEAVPVARTKSRTRDQPAPSLPSSPGLFALQVVGLEKAGCGFFVAAAGGWQRTPACRALVRAGYRRLSAGTPLLRASGADLQLLLLPRSRSSRRTKAPTSNPKSKTQNPKAAQRLPTPAATPPCRPRFLLFPQAVDWPESSLEPLRRSRALEELLPLTLLVRGRHLAPQEFHTAARLVETTECYRLHCGEDVSDLPALFDGLLNQRKATRPPSQSVAVKPPEANP
jgi:hypothetical protein